MANNYISNVLDPLHFLTKVNRFESKIYVWCMLFPFARVSDYLISLDHLSTKY